MTRCATHAPVLMRPKGEAAREPGKDQSRGLI